MGELQKSLVINCLQSSKVLCKFYQLLAAITTDFNHVVVPFDHFGSKTLQIIDVIAAEKAKEYCLASRKRHGESWPAVANQKRECRKAGPLTILHSLIRL